MIYIQSGKDFNAVSKQFDHFRVWTYFLHMEKTQKWCMSSCAILPRSRHPTKFTLRQNHTMLRETAENPRLCRPWLIFYVKAEKKLTEQVWLVWIKGIFSIRNMAVQFRFFKVASKFCFVCLKARLRGDFWACFAAMAPEHLAVIKLAQAPL